MKNRKLILLPSLILIFSVLFCMVCNSLKKQPNSNEFYSGTTEITDITEKSCETSSEKSEKDISSETSEIYATSRSAEESSYSETTRRDTETREKTTVVSVATTSSASLKSILVNGEWHFTTADGGVNCRFFNDCTYEVYDKNGNVDGGGYYCIDKNTVYIYDYCGNLINCFEYDKNTNEFNSILPVCEPTATTATEEFSEYKLNEDNVVSLLGDAVVCYDSFTNTTTFNLEYSYFGEYITCPHCGEQAFLVTNFNSFSDIRDYINRYLVGNAKNTAEVYVNESIGYGMLTEYNGSLYVCGAYNEKGYCGMDINTIRLISKNFDGSCVIAVDDFDNEETYYLDVYYVNGEYKIG